jgi:hypothetical protein
MRRSAHGRAVQPASQRGSHERLQPTGGLRTLPTPRASAILTKLHGRMIQYGPIRDCRTVSTSQALSAAQWVALEVPLVFPMVARDPYDGRDGMRDPTARGLGHQKARRYACDWNSL